ncbi:hypothetical protein RF55_25503, partial [Lasius niger]
MWSKEDIDALNREEDELVCKIMKKMKFEAIKTRREERRNMLEKLLGEVNEEMGNVSTDK